RSRRSEIRLRNRSASPDCDRRDQEHRRYCKRRHWGPIQFACIGSAYTHIRGRSDRRQCPPPLPKLAFVSGSNAFSPSMPVDEPKVMFTKMYLDSTSMNASASCARAANGETKIAALSAAKKTHRLLAAQRE